MLIKAEESVLLVVDVQERLLPAMAEPDLVVDNITRLIRSARRLAVPIVASEQYRKGLGLTVAPLRTLMEEDERLEKLHFSCAQDPDIAARIESLGRRQIVICGIEAHVCVLQSALGFQSRGLSSFVVADATSTRSQDSKRLALERLGAAGINVVSVEMVLFEWLNQADTPAFRDLRELIK